MGSNGTATSYLGTDNAVSRSVSPTLPLSRSHSPSQFSGQTSPQPGWPSRLGSTGYGPGARKFLGYTPTTPIRYGWGILGRFRAMVSRRPRLSSFLFLTISLFLFVFLRLHLNPVSSRLRAASGGSKFVIILAANQGGGVMTWKGPKEWAVERDSIANKRAYAQRWGYHLEIKDMSTKKRYAHEWRESWEKVDVIKQTMRQYPKAEWFWWLDLHTFIMEPSVSLQSHIFKNIQDVTYRDINLYNPLNITHPPLDKDFFFIDDLASSPVGDDKPESINIIVPQDCGGFNLGSFFIKRSEFSERLLDLWWDPVGYEQKHMEWEHKEQDALEYLYTNQPWIRTGTAFIPQRMINAFPPGACSETPEDPRIFYKEKDRDFVVNMAGCEWGRDCWGEMASYRKVSERLNKGWWKNHF